MKILVIEDDKSTQVLIEKILASTDVTVCSTAMEGINAFVDNMTSFDSFEAVLLDINLPDMSGVHALKLIRKFEEVKNIMDNRRAKIIMMTGTADEQNVKDSLKNGCDQFLIKPVEKAKIEAKFKAVGLKLSLIEKVEAKPAAAEEQASEEATGS